MVRDETSAALLKLSALQIGQDETRDERHARLNHQGDATRRALGVARDDRFVERGEPRTRRDESSRLALAMEPRVCPPGGFCLEPRSVFFTRTWRGCYRHSLSYPRYRSLHVPPHPNRRRQSYVQHKSASHGVRPTALFSIRHGPTPAIPWSV